MVESGPASGFGSATRSVYGHIDRSLVQEVRRVRAGQRIMVMGSHGPSTGPPLHVEIRDSADPRVDPRAWLAPAASGSTGNA